MALVIIDPITSYMGTRIDSHRTTDVRGVLEPLGRFADEAGVAVLAITHPPKAAQGSAINSFTGSLAFVATARMAFIATEEPETERRLLLPVKHNLGPKAPGLAYRFEQRIVSKGIVGSHIAWDIAPVTVTADEAFCGRLTRIAVRLPTRRSSYAIIFLPVLLLRISSPMLRNAMTSATGCYARHAKSCAL